MGGIGEKTHRGNYTQWYKIRYRNEENGVVWSGPDPEMVDTRPTPPGRPTDRVVETCCWTVYVFSIVRTCPRKVPSNLLCGYFSRPTSHWVRTSLFCTSVTRLRHFVVSGLFRLSYFSSFVLLIFPFSSSFNYIFIVFLRQPIFRRVLDFVFEPGLFFFRQIREFDNCLIVSTTASGVRYLSRR